jgi:hypothetical protein
MFRHVRLEWSKLKANSCPLLDRAAPSSHRNRSSGSFRRLR